MLGLAFRTACRIYAIPSASMQPGLQPGDHILVTNAGLRNSLERGDVIVFHSPSDPQQLLVKRVIGLPGDLIESRSGRLTIGGHAVAETYVPAAASTGSIAPQLVPPDCYFVLGDNRADSFDSRNWGFLPRGLVTGRARLVLWSSAGAAPGSTARASSRATPASANVPGIRWDRVFRLIH